MIEYIYEVIDTTDDEGYRQLGIFLTFEKAVAEINAHDSIGKKVSDYSEDNETISVKKIKIGWCADYIAPITIFERQEYYDEELEKYVWQTVRIKR